MDGWRTQEDSAYHGAAMIFRTASCLACLALAPSLALAQKAYAPAEERPGRIVIGAIAVDRPAGPGWALVRRADDGLTFLRPANKEHSGLVAIASAKVPAKRLRDAGELAERLRADLKEQADPKRFEVLTEDIRPDGAAGRQCVRYRQLVRDLGPADAAGKAQQIDLHGLLCLHPYDEGIVLTTTLSERAPEGSDGRAVAEIAERFFNGVKPHVALHDRDWQQRAVEGDVNAQVWHARSQLAGSRPEGAIGWLQRAATAGHPEAQALLGLAYLTGRAAQRDFEQALRWLRQAAEAGYPKAEGLLGYALVTSRDASHHEEGRRWTRKAAEDGDPLGQALLGELLFFGRGGMERNGAEGARWTRQAAEQGDARAQYMLASLLANGEGMEMNAAEARFWLELSAIQGNNDAQQVLDAARRSEPAPPPRK